MRHSTATAEHKNDEGYTNTYEDRDVLRNPEFGLKDLFEIQVLVMCALINLSMRKT